MSLWNEESGDGLLHGDVGKAERSQPGEKRGSGSTLEGTGLVQSTGARFWRRISTGLIL